MTQRAFEILFIANLVAPPAAVLIGLLLLVIPRFRCGVGRASVPAHA